MKKLFILASCTVLCSGFAFSIYQAANDYGMKENKLHSAIVAQSDETSGGGSGGGTCDPDIYVCSAYLNFNTRYIYVTSNVNGTIFILGKEYNGYKSSTTYKVSLVDRLCESLINSNNKCKKSEETTYVEGIVEGDGTTTD